MILDRIVQAASDVRSGASTRPKESFFLCKIVTRES